MSEKYEIDLESILKYFHIIADSAKDAIYIEDNEGKIVYWNRAAQQIFDYTKKEAVGEILHQLLTPKRFHEAHSKILESFQRTGKYPYDNMTGEFVARKKSGEEFPVEVSFSTWDIRGKTYIVGFIRDVTLRKQAEQALKDSEEKIRGMAESVQDAIIMIDDELKISYWNGSAERIYGYTKEEAIGQDIIKLLAPKRFHKGYIEIFRQIEKTGSASIIDRINEAAGIRKDGTEFPIEFSCSVLKLQGRLNVITVVRDITERKLAEEERKRDYLNNIGVMIVAINADQTVDFINQKGCEILGIGREEIIGRNWFDNFLPKRLRREVKNVFVALMSGGRKDNGVPPATYENPVITRDGKEKIIRWNNTLIEDENGSYIGTLSSGEDVTEEKKIRAAFADSEEKITAIAESAQDAVIMMDNDGNIAYWNRAAEMTFGYTREKVIGKNVHYLIAPERYHERYKNAFKQFQKLGKGSVIGKILELEAVRSDGTEIPIELSVSRVMLQGRWNAIGIARDITERKRAEEEIKLHEIRLQSMLELNKMIDAPEKEIMDFVTEEIIKVTQSAIAFVGLMNKSETVFVQYGCSKEAMKECAMNDRPLYFPIEKAGIWGDAVRERKPVIINDYAAPYPGKKGYPEGHIVLKRLLCVPVFDGDIIVALACVANKEKDYGESDVNVLTSMLSDMWRLLKHKRVEEEKERLWEQLLQSQKLESIGKLTGTMAHDFKNILLTVVGYSEMVMKTLPENLPERTHLERIKYVGEKSINVINQLLAFSRRQALDMKVGNLNAVLNDNLKMLTSMAGGSVNVVLNNNKVRNVLIDLSQIEQALMNLVVNARDAMPDGGRITIETADVEISAENQAKHPGMKEGSYVMLSITDTGIGMTKSVRERAFEPFFTTKEEEGNGLGLSTVFGIIKQHSGYIFVESEPGKGAKFDIYLPVA